MWVDGAESVTGDTIPCAFWKYEKTNGHEVYVMSFSGESWQTPHWVDVIAAFEPGIQPIRVATHFRDFLMNDNVNQMSDSDTTGMGESAHECMNWLIAQDWKATFSLDEYYYDDWTIDDLATKVFANGDIETVRNPAICMFLIQESFQFSL